MSRLFSISIDTFAFLVILLPMFFILHFTLFRQQGRKKNALIFIFALYLSAVFSATGIPNIKTVTLDPSFNWLPFLDIAGSPAGYLKNTLLNIVLFMPFGFLLPAIWADCRALKTTAFAGLALSLTIEILQIFTFRLTDVDDLITNTAGAALGYFLARLCLGKIWKNAPAAEMKNTSKHEPFFIFISVLVLMCFLHPFIAGALWNFVLESSLWK